MGASETLGRGRELLERPGQTLLVAFGVVVVLDLALKLAGVRVLMLGGDLTTRRLFANVSDGVARGLIFGLAGVGLSITYSILNFANFSHGDLITTGAFTGWGVAYLIVGSETLTAGELLLVRPGGVGTPGEIGANVTTAPLALVVGLVVAGVVTAGLALLIDRLVYRPLRDREGIILLISSVGVAFTLRYVIQFVYGSRTRRVASAIDQSEPAVTLFGRTVVTGAGDLNVFGLFQYDVTTATLIVVSLSIMVGLHLLLQRTKLGIAMRAMADNEDLALVTGIPTERIVTATWVIGGGITGVAGFLIVLTRSIRFNFGWLLLLLVFAAVILGGIGSVYGAIAGGLLIGLTLTLSTIWIPSDFSPRVIAFLAMILALLFRPEGLFGGVSTA